MSAVRASAYGLQFHRVVRPEDLDGCTAVPGYLPILERTGVEWGDVRAALERVGPALDALAERLLERCSAWSPVPPQYACD